MTTEMNQPHDSPEIRQYHQGCTNSEFSSSVPWNLNKKQKKSAVKKFSEQAHFRPQQLEIETMSMEYSTIQHKLSTDEQKGFLQ